MHAAVSEAGVPEARTGELCLGNAASAAGPSAAHHVPEVRPLGHVPLGEVGVERGRAVNLEAADARATLSERGGAGSPRGGAAMR